MFTILGLVPVFAALNLASASPVILPASPGIQALTGAVEIENVNV